MEAGPLASEFLELLRKFRNSVDKEIESLEHSREDINVLKKTVNEVSSLLGKEGLSFFVGELKKMLQQMILAENNPESMKENGLTTKEDVGTIEAEKTSVDTSSVEPMDVVSEIKEERVVSEKEKEGLYPAPDDTLLKCKKEWPLQHAKLLSHIIVPIMPNIPLDRHTGLIYQLDDMRLCNDTKSLADTLYVIKGNIRNEIFFNCFENQAGTIRADLDCHTPIARRIYQRMVNLITLYGDPQRQQVYQKAMWKRFTIRINDQGESLLDIKTCFTDGEVMFIKHYLQEEFTSAEAKDCNIRALILTNGATEFTTYTLIGKSSIVEKLYSMSFTVNGSPLCLWNPVAMKNLSESLLNLAKLNRQQTGVLVVEAISAVPILCMAKACRKIVLLHQTSTVRKFITAEAAMNSILNFSSSDSPLNENIDKDFSQCKEICLVVYNIMNIRCKKVPWICQNMKFTKLLCLAPFDDICALKRLTMFCNQLVENPFVITRAVPIDMSPFTPNIQMLVLLERVSQIQGGVKSNPGFSGKSVTHFLSMNDSKFTGKRKPAEALNNLRALLRGLQNEIVSYKYDWKIACGEDECLIDTEFLQDVSLTNMETVQNVAMGNEEPRENVPMDSEEPVQNVSVGNKEPVRTASMGKEEPVENVSVGNEEPVQNVSMSNEEPVKNVSMSNEEPVKKVPIANKEPIQNVQQDKEILKKADSQSGKVELQGVSKSENAFLTDLNESQKTIMIQILNELDDCSKLNVNEEYITAVNLKKELVNFEANSLSSTLMPVLPHLTYKASSGLAFQQLDMTPCIQTKTHCQKYHIVLERNSPTGKIVNTLNCDNELIPLRKSLSDKAKNICKLIATFIVKSEYPMFGLENQGFWRGMTIRINNKNEPWLMIEAGADTVEKAKMILLDLAPKLRLFLKSGLGPKLAPDLKDVVLSISTKTSTESRVIFGENMVNEQVGQFKVKVHGKRFPYYNPSGMVQLSQEILKLSAVDKRWGVVQVGCGCGIESLRLSRDCGEIYLVRQPGVLNMFFLAKENGIKNFVYHPVSREEAMVTVLLKNMSKYSHVCVIYDLSDSVGFFGASVLRNTYTVKRIIYIINGNNTDWIKEVVGCCQIRNDWKEPFVVTKFTAVDMAPCDENVNIMCVLERKSLVQGGVKINSAFSEKAVLELLSGQMHMTEDVKSTSNENEDASVKSIKRDEEKSVKAPEKTNEDKNFEKSNDLFGSNKKNVESPVKQLASDNVSSNQQSIPNNTNQQYVPNKPPNENVRQTFPENLHANNLAKPQISTTVRPGPEINQNLAQSQISTAVSSGSQINQNILTKPSLSRDSLYKGETSVTSVGGNNIQRDIIAANLDYIRPISSYIAKDIEKDIGAKTRNSNVDLIAKTSPSRINIRSEVSPLLERTPQSSSQSSVQLQSRCEDNRQTFSRVNTKSEISEIDYRSRGLSRIDYPSRDSLTDYRSRSPLRTDYRPYSPSGADYRSRNPLGADYRPHTGDYRSRSPLIIDYGNQSLEKVRGRSPQRIRADNSQLVRGRSPQEIRRQNPTGLRAQSPEGVRTRSPLGIRAPSPQRSDYRYHTSQEVDYHSRGVQVIDYKSGVPERINYRSHSPVKDDYSRSRSSFVQGLDSWKPDYRSTSSDMTDRRSSDHRFPSPNRSAHSSDRSLPINYDRHSSNTSHRTFDYKNNDGYSSRSKNFQGSNYY